MTQLGSGRRWRARWAAAGAVAGALAVLGGCKDSNVPFLTAPTAVPNSPAGIQNAVAGLIAGSRNDMGTYVITVTAGYARDGAVFTNTEPRTVTYPLGVQRVPNTSGQVWQFAYQNIYQAQQILATIPKVAPAYTAAQAASLAGIVQTLEAWNYMLILESHDTLGMAILPAGLTSTSTLAQAVCMKDGWAYIVALLDSANGNLVTAGATPPPIKLPNGFSGVSAVSGPGTQAGSFASFNRALAAKANLELAYAIARQNHVGPTPTTPGSPDPAALAAAAADIASTAMYNPAALAPTTPGSFSADAFDVLLDFSAQSGDLVNPVNAQIGTEAQLNDFLADVDTAHDLRFKAKFRINPNPVQQQTYNPVALETHLVNGKDSTYSWLYNMYASPGSGLPIIREEEMVLWNAQILLGQGNLAGALGLVNQVRTTVGGLAPYPAGDAGSFTTVRDDLMREQRISTTWEANASRTISIRMYGLAAVSDTTWLHEDPSVTTGDLHTTVDPIPQAELDGRGGRWNPSCK